jgi:benzylsuccinate CoA-transferase BbsF subunit
VTGALDGLKVVELGGYAAGPVVGKYLGNYGAEVIRIESRTRLDGFRTHYPPYKDNLPGADRAGIFNYFNDGKRSVTLNLKTQRGLELARALIDRADVVVENFTPGTMGRLGLGYETMRQTNPRLVMLSTCNQGQTGPRATQPGFGSHLTSLSGFTQLLGQRDGTPVLLYGPYIDYVAVGYGTAAVLAALVRRRLTGRGTHIDLSQYESGLQFLTPALLDFWVNGRIATRHGNRHLSACPHGVFPCLGEERWVALSVWDDTEWQTFVRALGAPDWACQEVYTTLLGRKAHEDQLECEVANWTRSLDRDDVVRLLCGHGLRVAAVSSMQDLFADPQLRTWGVWQAVDHPVLGRMHVAAPPFRLHDTPPRVDRAAPLLGADTVSVLHNILGLDTAEIDSLEQAGVLT